MKIGSKAIAVLIVMIFLGCQKDVDTSVSIQDELQPFFTSFATEAEVRGIVVDYNQGGIQASLGILTGGVVGRCYHNEDEPNEIVIDVVYWNSANPLQKEFLVFHELGHCILNRNHVDETDDNGNCLSIMHSTGGVCNFNYNGSTRTSYIDELFE